MRWLKKIFINNYKEMLYQLAIVVVLFLFFSFVQDGTEKIASYKISFFLNYMVCAMVINYVLLPKLYYQKKIIYFFISVLVAIFLVIMIDEFVLEQIYFPDTRGTYFPGVLFTLVETLPVILIFVGFKIAWDFNKKQREIEQLKTLAQENELQYLKSQINPHFLFNNLNNLYAYAIENSPKTPSIIVELSSVLRYMLYDCKENFVSLSKEINHLKNYTALNELRVEHNGIVNFKANVDKYSFTIAPLILTVFVENAFKHSTSSQSEDIFVEIDVKVSNKGLLVFKCKNSFLPEANNQNLASGIGLKNVKKRLQILYPAMHTLDIFDKENIYTIVLKLNLNN
ncbi:sensor histidine kinase [Wenyingzhuangia sp. IMCC45467]